MKAFFFGAGASCGTFQTSATPVPVPAKFGQVLHALGNDWASKYPELVKVVDHLCLPRNDWGLEPVWTCIDYYAKFTAKPKPIFDDPTWCAKIVSRELRKALLEVYGRRCDDAAEKKLPLKDNYTLGNLIKNELSGGDVLISFNYDTIVERLTRRFRRDIRSVNARKAKANTTIILIKPHGSTSWKKSDKSAPWNVESEKLPGNHPLFDSMLPADVNDHEEPLLLGTVPIKSELIREVQDYKQCPNAQSWVQVFETIRNQWKAVRCAISEADRIILVGYGFPREDQYGRFIIRESIHLRSIKPLIVEFFELKDRASDQAKEIMDAFDCRIDKLIYRGEVEPFP